MRDELKAITAATRQQRALAAQQQKESEIWQCPAFMAFRDIVTSNASAIKKILYEQAHKGLSSYVIVLAGVPPVTKWHKEVKELIAAVVAEHLSSDLSVQYWDTDLEGRSLKDPEVVISWD